MREENAAERASGLPPPPAVGKSLFYASPTAPNLSQEPEQERAQPAPPAPAENPEWDRPLEKYYGDLNESLEKAVVTVTTLLDVALRVKRDADALFAEAHARRSEVEMEIDRLRTRHTAMEREMNALRGARDREHREVQRILADTIERIGQLPSPEVPVRDPTES